MDNKKINFSGDFEKDIVLTLQEIQKQENTQKVPIPKLHIIGFLLFSIVIFIGSYYFISLGGYPEKNLAFVAIFIVALGFLLFSNRDETGVIDLKYEIFDVVLEKLNFIHEESEIYEEVFMESKLFSKFDNFEVLSDFIGYDDGFSLSIAEVILSTKSHLNSNVNSSDIDFCGLAVYYCFDNLDLKDTQIIIKNKEIFTFFDPLKKLEKIKFDKEKLDDSLEIYTTNALVAKRAINHHFIEKFEKIQAYFSDFKISCSMRENTILLTIESEIEHFKITSYKIEKIKQEIDVFLRELKVLNEFGKGINELCKSSVYRF
ncbi:DUF3137 domain-containing protein [Campylobacter jejuni]|uniref:DUF3137 domain-containing protein n=1 Tax=Campylobacter jejuni TaxID=197 RepID=UPI003A87FEFD